ncbi:hypothetical protein AG1IA_07944 [Rhizoctonia solani AG-1 IA]|uniref:Uncharacterized protein n=1 Tax=Thanatephorus cucumeris (strain AG1-IA) TaxID=983506 RepID=L8WML0_THACA|nr:hypothetical protein AG1IA_07944 [Rhizoctonia solani AG-1 IA]
MTYLLKTKNPLDIVNSCQLAQVVAPRSVMISLDVLIALFKRRCQLQCPTNGDTRELEEVSYGIITGSHLHKSIKYAYMIYTRYPATQTRK